MLLTLVLDTKTKTNKEKKKDTTKLQQKKNNNNINNKYHSTTMENEMQTTQKPSNYQVPTMPASNKDNDTHSNKHQATKQPRTAH